MFWAAHPCELQSCNCHPMIWVEANPIARPTPHVPSGYAILTRMIYQCVVSHFSYFFFFWANALLRLPFFSILNIIYPHSRHEIEILSHALFLWHTIWLGLLSVANVSELSKTNWIICLGPWGYARRIDFRVQGNSKLFPAGCLLGPPGCGPFARNGRGALRQKLSS